MVKFFTIFGYDVLIVAGSRTIYGIDGPPTRMPHMVWHRFGPAGRRGFHLLIRRPAIEITVERRPT